MRYKVRARYHQTAFFHELYEVEANSKEEAQQLVEEGKGNWQGEDQYDGSEHREWEVISVMEV